MEEDIKNLLELAMTLDEFIEALYKAGWRAPNDAQHQHIKELWEELCLRGMIINSIAPKGRYWSKMNVPRPESNCT